MFNNEISTHNKGVGQPVQLHYRVASKEDAQKGILFTTEWLV